MQKSNNKFQVGNRFHLGKKIGVGGFGEVYLAQDTVANKDCAIKMESRTNGMSILNYEYKILQHLISVEGIPKVHKYGS